ncbi:MAG: manganese efflux pump MntP family protein [Desulfuromonas thiophila]|jgi:putative Mn2+ efflux pump MntP|nr:manganese efflux pump MntP family protein [Desulfuromonas thiophila]
MALATLLGLAVALAMDAFAVALATAAALPCVTGRHLFRLSFHFGLFQGLMPVLGWLAGVRLQQLIAAYDHWVAFALLLWVGGKMLYEAFQPDDGDSPRCDPTRGLTLVTLSLATSIDALAVGLTLGVLGVSVWWPALVIALVAGAFTLVGMLLGCRIGQLWGPRMEMVGGLVLCGLGLKILLEHLTLA